jgi:hypothetical protein
MNMVDDQRAKVAELDAANVPHVQDNPAEPRRASLIRNAPNEKFIGPGRVHFDVRDKGWNEAIRSNTQLHDLKPVTSDRQAAATQAARPAVQFLEAARTKLSLNRGRTGVEAAQPDGPTFGRNAGYILGFHPGWKLRTLCATISHPIG